MNSWYAHGKLLITGEYLVLEGALALALPLKVGQSLSVTEVEEKHLSWEASYLQKKWFSANLSIPKLEIDAREKEDLALQLRKILLQLRQLKPGFLDENKGFSVKTNLSFNPEYGFGSSSTLIANLARWAEINPYMLQNITFGGSGYDIACALSGKPLFFQLKNEKPFVTEITFKPGFSDKLFFVYLGKKQKSFESILHFKENAVFGKNEIEQISEISRLIIKAGNLVDFENLLHEHEQLMSRILRRQTVKELLFSSFPGTVKSLGAWGGDFVLMTFDGGKEKLKEYLAPKNLDVVFSYDELILA